MEEIVTKADWKLFRERIDGWQESYMEKLNREHISVLGGERSLQRLL